MNIIMIEIRNNAFIRYNVINILDIDINDFSHYFIVNAVHLLNTTQPTYPMSDFIKNPNLFKTGLFKMFDVENVENMNINYFLLLDEKYVNSIKNTSDIVQKFIIKYNTDIRNKKMDELISWLK